MKTLRTHVSDDSVGVSPAFVFVCFGPILRAANVQSSYCSNSSGQKVVVSAFVFWLLVDEIARKYEEFSYKYTKNKRKLRANEATRPH